MAHSRGVRNSSVSVLFRSEVPESSGASLSLCSRRITGSICMQWAGIAEPWKHFANWLFSFRLHCKDWYIEKQWMLPGHRFWEFSTLIVFPTQLIPEPKETFSFCGKNNDKFKSFLQRFVNSKMLQNELCDSNRALKSKRLLKKQLDFVAKNAKVQNVFSEKTKGEIQKLQTNKIRQQLRKVAQKKKHIAWIQPRATLLFLLSPDDLELTLHSSFSNTFCFAVSLRSHSTSGMCSIPCWWRWQKVISWSRNRYLTSLFIRTR